MPKSHWVFFCALLLPLTAKGQGDRYELGLRVRMLEEVFETKRTDETAKKRACDPTNKAVQSFFSFNFQQASKNLDVARYALLSEKPVPEAVQYAETLTLRAVCRWVDAQDSEIAFTVNPFYKLEGKTPEGLTARIKVANGGWKESELSKFPLTILYPAKELGETLGDLPVVLEIRQKDQVLATRKTSISRTKDLAARLNRLKEHKTELPALEKATVSSLIKLLEDLANKGSPETEYPADRLLKEVETIVEKKNKTGEYYGVNQSGQFWLTVPIAKTTAPIRIFIPKGLAKDKKVPVVVALHGAGGSENMFFDAYGAGITQKLCEQRGWIMIATRAVGAFGVGGAPNVNEIIETLSQRYPIDPQKVFLVGHSMGAAHTLQLAQATPEKYRGIVILGGGGAPRKEDALKAVPVFVGVGVADFALSGAKSLANALKKVEGQKLVYKEYANIEHLLIVQEAAPEFFQFFDDLVK
ncbi:MAG: alpha/beta hydrolase [Gemmataceae bacterium]|nr:alpha/beta hydrolase [Gemmataceae bacterium]